MKISELIPPKLPGIVIRTIQGLMTGEDHDYLKKHCNIDVLESWFCDDNSIELEINLEDGTIDTIDLGDVTKLSADWKLNNYQELVFYNLIVHATAQLPDWVYDGSKFYFDWTPHPELTLQEFDASYEKVWDIVFNGKGPKWWRRMLPNTWCAGKDALTSLESDILCTMFGISGCQDDPLPAWLREGNFAPSFPISRELISNLEELYQGFLEESLACTRVTNALSLLPGRNLFDEEGATLSDQQADSDGESYISPFTGQSK